MEQQIKGFPTIDESSQTETRKAPEKSKMQEEMELFKMQMAYIDSLQNPRPRTPQKKQDEKPKEKAIEVVKAKNPAEVYFNTVGKEQKTSLITAILDETLKVTFPIYFPRLSIYKLHTYSHIGNYPSITTTCTTP